MVPAGIRTVEKLSTQLLFELRDLVTQRRLHDEAALRRASEIAEFGHRDDVLQLLKVHQTIVNGDRPHDNNALDSSLALPEGGVPDHGREAGREMT